LAGDVTAGVMERARAGDPAAFEQVVRHYDPMLRALAYAYSGTAPRWTTPSRRPT
jgi:DNA-directed RNA polymerase specialized sigma24 family protein